MKKGLSLVTALATLVTVGGVYAAWNYAEGTASKSKTLDAPLKMVTPNLTTASGTIEIHNSLALFIDDNEGNYKPGWDDYYAAGGEGVSDQGKLDITFTPTNTTTAETTLQYTITIKGNAYTANENTSQIFILTRNIDDNDGDNTTGIILQGEFTYESGASKTHSISYSEFTEALQVNSAISLPKYANYLEYETAVKGVEITVSVVEVDE